MKAQVTLQSSNIDRTTVILYSLSYAYWLAAFPGLARNTPTLREHAEKYNSGEISREEYDAVDSMKRNEICNTALFIDGIGEVPLIAIAVGILYGVHSNESTANNSWGLSVFMAWTSAFWLGLAIPWFVLEKRRPGQPLPPGRSYITAGLWQLYRASIQIWRLKQSLAYLIGMLSQKLPEKLQTNRTLQAFSSSATRSTLPLSLSRLSRMKFRSTIPSSYASYIWSSSLRKESVFTYLCMFNAGGISALRQCSTHPP